MYRTQNKNISLFGVYFISLLLAKVLLKISHFQRQKRFSDIRLVKVNLDNTFLWTEFAKLNPVKLNIFCH